MKHSQLFIDSLIHPKKLGAYRLLPIGKVIQYVFILVTLVTVFSFSQFLTGVSPSSLNMDGLQDYIENIKWLLYPFSFLLLFVITTLLLYLRISVYALVGLVILKATSRKGEYRHIWRTSAFSVTWAVILSIILPFTTLNEKLDTLLSIIITLIVLFIALSKYPKQPK